jgi:hypothetical protein
MTVRKGSRTHQSRSDVQPPRSNEIIDMEVNCTICQKRLYVPDSSIGAVVASLEQTGAVILICPSGHTQLIGWRMPPRRKLHA